MGTRNLTLVFMDGEYRVAQYAQWDGYPSGQGAVVLSFLKEKLDLEVFKEKVKATSWINREELAQLWEDCGADPKSDFVGMDVSDRFSKKYPYLHRDCGAKVLEMIQESENGLKLNSQLEFAADSLFCEWAYVVDLDKEVLEVYKGFNQEPLTENDRFFFLTESSQKDHRTDQYSPVKLVMSYSFGKLPSEEDFVKECEGREEDEE